MEQFYAGIERAARLYDLLEDELSREIFWARLRFDVGQDMESLIRLAELAGGHVNRFEYENGPWKDIFARLYNDGKKVILYGAGGAGCIVGKSMIASNLDFYGFCDIQYRTMKDGLLGKPVLAPDYLFQNCQDCYVIITAIGSRSEEIADFLEENGFLSDHILPLFSKSNHSVIARQYFEFPELYKGEAFIDAGCYRCENSIEFADWCGGKYSEIYAFEPDEKNFEYCRQIADEHPELRINLLQAGLGDQQKNASFSSFGSSESYVIDRANTSNIEIPQSMESETQEIRIETIDNVLQGKKAGFIKMDIEGFEYPALVGAKNTIARDKPLCAICVYHRNGDVLAIMDFLHTLVPEYRFWLRHYSTTYCETVLYAGI